MKYITINKTSLDKSKFNIISNKTYYSDGSGGINEKPQGGLWASPYYPKRKYKSDWIRWCSIEMPDWISKDTVILELKETAKIYKINSLLDTINLGERVGYNECLNYNNTQVMQLYINWENVSKIYDAVLLTENGLNEMKRAFYDNCKLYFYSWDCESILIMNYDCIKEWKYKKIK